MNRKYQEGTIDRQVAQGNIEDNEYTRRLDGRDGFVDITQVKTFQMAHFDYVQLIICQLWTNTAFFHYILEKYWL